MACRSRLDEALEDNFSSDRPTALYVTQFDNQKAAEVQQNVLGQTLRRSQTELIVRLMECKRRRGLGNALYRMESRGPRARDR